MVRVRYVPTELSEGVVENLDADYFVIQEDNTVELRRNTGDRRYKVVGFIHPTRWLSVVQVQDAEV